MTSTPVLTGKDIASKHNSLCNALDSLREFVSNASDELADEGAKFEAWNPDAIICRGRTIFIDDDGWRGYRQKARQIGFAKVNNKWCFSVRKVIMSADWIPQTGEYALEEPAKQDESDLEYVRLSEAPRKILIALLEDFAWERDDEDVLDALRNGVLQAMDERIQHLAGRLEKTVEKLKKQDLAA